MKFILGQKKFMTQIFREDGSVVPVTAVKADPNVITQIKTQERDGYNAVQVGSGATRKRMTKPVAGHVKNDVASRWIKEFRLNEAQAESMKDVTVGTKIGVSMFRPGDAVQVVGVSKGRGFQGVVKRHGFRGASTTHGTKDQVRMPGSVGATGPARVFKGVRMGGRMGTDQVTVAGLSVVKVDVDENLLYIKGALPGSVNSLVIISGPGRFAALANDANKANDADVEEDVVVEDVVDEKATEEVSEQTAEATETTTEETTEEQKEADVSEESAEKVEEPVESKEETTEEKPK